MTQSDQSTFSYIDGYCERKHDPSPMAEPLNLFTNLAFVIGALMVFKAMKAYNMLTPRNWDITLLTVILAAIGFGSAAFHSVPNALTLNMDVLPITLFIHLYVISFFIRVIGLKPISAILVVLLFFGAELFFENTFSRNTLNGTIMYIPTYLMMLVMVLLLGFIKQNPLYLHLINTAVIWTFSLAFRTVDMQICTHTQYIGTHFIWHLLNAIVLYRMLMLLIMDRVIRRNSVQAV